MTTRTDGDDVTQCYLRPRPASASGTDSGSDLKGGAGSAPPWGSTSTMLSAAATSPPHHCDTARERAPWARAHCCRRAARNCVTVPSQQFAARRCERNDTPNQRPDLQNILRRSYDNLTIMRSTYDGRLIHHQTFHEECKAFLGYDSLGKSSDRARQCS